MNTDKNVIEGLKDLYSKNHDAQLGFKKASENVENANLKAFFKDKMRQRRKFGKEIERHFIQLGVDVSLEGSLIGKAHRFWIDVVGTFTGKDEEAILDTCEDAEEKAIEEYKEFLKVDNISHLVRDMALRQMREIEETKREIDFLEDEFEA